MKAVVLVLLVSFAVAVLVNEARGHGHRHGHHGGGEGCGGHQTTSSGQTTESSEMPTDGGDGSSSESTMSTEGST